MALWRLSSASDTLVPRGVSILMSWREIMQNEFCPRITCFRHKNIRTKDSLNVQMSVQAGLTYLCSFNVCTFGAWLSAFLLERTQAWVFVIFFRHKNIRFIECSNVCSSELDILLSFQCLHLWCCVYDELLLQMNRRYCFFKNVCCMVNTSFACLMNI